MSYILCVYLLTFFFIQKPFQPQDTTGALSYWPFFKFQISMLCNCLPISATADVFCHIMHFSSSTWFCFASTYVQPSTVKILPRFILHSGTPAYAGTSRPICRAICRSGQQCRNSATLGSDVCRRHNSDSSFHWYCKEQKQGCVAEGCILF